MNQHIKPLQKYQEQKGIKRSYRTEPAQPQKSDQDSKAHEAKLYLMNLNKEVDSHYRPSVQKNKTQMDHSVSEWNHHETKNNKLTTPQNRNHSSNRQKKEPLQSKPVLQALTTFEQELVQTGFNKKDKLRKRSNWSETTRKRPKKEGESQTIEIQLENTLNQIKVGLQKTPPKVTFVRQFQVNQFKKMKNHKVDISLTTSLKEGSPRSDRWSQQRQASERLPRLDRMVPQQFKNKYKSIFRHNPSIKYSLPIQSKLGQDITRIHRLIEEENIRLIKIQHT